MKNLLLLCLLITPGWSLSAQVVLQIEKKGSAKTRKIEVGTLLEYKMYEFEDWQRGYVENLIPEENIIVFNNRYVKIGDIRRIRFDTPQRWSGPLGRNLMLFGVAWGLFSGVAAIIDESDPFGAGDLSITLSAPATGFLLQRIFRYKKYRLDGKHQLRILDMRLR